MEHTVNSNSGKRYEFYMVTAGYLGGEVGAMASRNGDIIDLFFGAATIAYNVRDVKRVPADNATKYLRAILRNRGTNA